MFTVHDSAVVILIYINDLPKSNYDYKIIRKRRDLQCYNFGWKMASINDDMANGNENFDEDDCGEGEISDEREENCEEDDEIIIDNYHGR